MKNKKTFITVSSFSIVVLVASLFLLNSAYAGKDCGSEHTSKVPSVVATEHHVDEHAGHNHPVKKEHTEHADEHAGHNHAPAKLPVKHVDEHDGHNHAPKEKHIQ